MPTTAPTLADIFSHTPTWVWLVLLAVLYLGLQRTRDRVVSLGRLLLLPLIMAGYALAGLGGASLSMLPAIFVGLAAGGVSGWLLEPAGSTRRLADGRAWVRGEWLTLVQVLVVFVFRYTSSVIAVAAPRLAADGAYQLVMFCLIGFFAALFLGRTAARLTAYFTTVPATA